jgi:hypothetical protein
MRLTTDVPLDVMIEHTFSMCQAVQEVFTMARAYRNKDRIARGAQARTAALSDAVAAGAVSEGEEMPEPGAPIEERQRWLLEHRGPEFLAPEVLEELRERVCAMPECESRAVPRSLFCGYHQQTAVGEAGARELRQLTREMERMGRITDKEAKAHAVRKFRRRVESGDFAILFSGKMQETIERAAEDAELGMELGSVRVALALAIQQIDDPERLSMAISRLANASARTVRANTARKREERTRS